MIINAFKVILQPSILAMMVAAVVCGLIVGAIPGLNATMAMALFTPLTYSMDDANAFVVLCALYIGAISGGLYSAILMKIPGTPASIASSFDGFPLARKGQAGSTIGMALTASFVGGLFSFVMLSLFAPLLARFALKFGPAEYFAVSLLGLSTIASVVGNSAVKGMISAVLGLAIGTVGLDVIMGIPRFTGGNTMLTSGFDSMALLIGMFAVPQVLRDMSNPAFEKVEADASPKQMIPKWKTICEQKFNMLRSAIIGTWIGLLPGAGGSIASLMSYDQAKKASKTPEKFGTGVIDGVVASETANNAVIGGSLIPMLTLGIPGDTPAAVLLAAFTLHGMQCGPLLYVEHADTIDTVLVSLFVSNIIMILVAFAGARYIIRTLSIPKNYLLPVIIIMCIVGAYGGNQRRLDVFAMLLFGLFGLVMEKYNMSTGPLVLGVILGPLLEKNFRRAMQVSNNGILGIFSRPITAIVLVAALISFCLPFITSAVKKIKAHKGNIEETAVTIDPLLTRANRIVGIVTIIGAAIYYYAASQLQDGIFESLAYNPGFYPKVLAGILAFLGLLLIILKPQSGDEIADWVIDKKKIILEIILIFAYPIAMMEIGFVVTSVAYLFISTLVIGDVKEKKQILKGAIVSVITVVVILLIFEKVFYIFLPHGALY